MADITKANEQIAAWDKNLEKLKNGEFGAYKMPGEAEKALLRYWRAQAEAGYPSADENVRYWTEVTGMARELMEKCDEELDCSKKADCDICRAERLHEKGYRRASDVAREIAEEILEMAECYGGGVLFWQRMRKFASGLKQKYKESE